MPSTSGKEREAHLFLRPTLSYQRLQTTQPLSDDELYDKIRRTVTNKHELQVLESFLIFNKFVHSCRFPVMGGFTSAT